MNITQALSIIPRSLISLIALFIATKILGKKQVSELSLFDYVIGISIGNFTAEMILVLDTQLVNGIVAILTFGLAGYIMSYLSTKSIFFRKKIFGTPTIIMSEGKFIYKAFETLRIDINDFLEQARIAGYFSIEEIDYAIMEANGSISFLLKDQYQQPTKKDMKIKIEKASLPVNVVIDSSLMEENIKNSSHNKEFYLKELKKQGYTSYENILLAIYSNNSLIVYKKDEKKRPENTLE